MLEFLIAVTETSGYRFNGATLTTAAAEQWPGARSYRAEGRLASVAEVLLELPVADDLPVQLDVLREGKGLSLDAPTHVAAASAIAWVAATADIPDTGIIVLHWTDAAYPLRPGVTAAELLADAT